MVDAKESSGNRERSTAVTELKLLTLCLFLARVVSGSKSMRAFVKGDEVCLAPEDGCRNGRGVVEPGESVRDVEGWSSESPSSSSSRGRVEGMRLGLEPTDKRAPLLAEAEVGVAERVSDG